MNEGEGEGEEEGDGEQRTDLRRTMVFVSAWMHPRDTSVSAEAAAHWEASMLLTK